MGDIHISEAAIRQRSMRGHVIEVMKDEEADADSWNYGKGLMESGWKNVREEKNRLKNNNMTPVQEIGGLASYIDD